MENDGIQCTNETKFARISWNRTNYQKIKRIDSQYIIVDMIELMTPVKHCDSDVLAVNPSEKKGILYFC